MEDVHHHVHVVDQDPAPALIALDMPGLVARRFEALENGIGDRLHLHLGLAVTDDEEIAHRRQSAEIDQQDFFGLPAERVGRAIRVRPADVDALATRRGARRSGASHADRALKRLGIGGGR